MKRINKMILFILVMSMSSLLFGQIELFARNESLHFGVYNLNGESQEPSPSSKTIL